MPFLLVLKSLQISQKRLDFFFADLFYIKQADLPDLMACGQPR